jgi:hypothetical protein
MNVQYELYRAHGEDWAEAWAVTAAAAGSPTPWYNSIWENDEGQLKLGLASFCD